MNITKSVAAAGIAAVLLSAAPAFALGLDGSVKVNADARIAANASSSIGAGADVKLSAKAKAAAAEDARMTDRANQELTRRVNALNGLSTRVGDMKKLSDDEKGSLSSSIQAQIATLNDLRTKIGTDGTNTVQLHADVQSITSSYRIFALIMPQAAIQAAADRVLTIVDTLNTLGAKLQARIASSTSAGFNASTTAAAFADFTAKLADAQLQANTAVSSTVALKPDMGDKTIAAANLAALKSARTSIQMAQKDLVAARKDVGTIIKLVTSFKPTITATATTTNQ